MAIQIGDVVVFKGSVIARCGHSLSTQSIHGQVVALICNNRVAEVDVDGEQRRRSIPVANLTKVKNGKILDLA